MLEQTLRYLKTQEIWFYLVLGLLALWQIWKFSQAWDEYRGAAFGMERETAQAKINQAAIWLVLLIFMAVLIFVLVSVVAPSFPGANPLPTTTLNLMATPTITLPALQLTPGQTNEAQTTPEVVETFAPGCVPDQVMISSPKDGEVVSGIVKIQGSANIPNFGFYKYEIARPGETVWLSINAGESPVQNGDLGDWNTKLLPPGEYRLRLVVTDNQGFSLQPCEIQVSVIATPEG